jgi:hypothetical protein
VHVPSFLAGAVGEAGIARDDPLVERAGGGPVVFRVWVGEGRDADPLGVVRLLQPRRGLLAARVGGRNGVIDKLGLLINAVCAAWPASSACAGGGRVGEAASVRAGLGAARLAMGRRTWGGGVVIADEASMGMFLPRPPSRARPLESWQLAWRCSWP